MIPLAVKRLVNAKGELKALSRAGRELKLGKWDDSVRFLSSQVNDQGKNFRQCFWICLS